MAESEMNELGEDLEIAGDVVATEGAMEMLDGADDLDIARDAAAIGVAEVAAAASDLTRAVDAEIVAERVQHLSEVVGEAGVVDVAEGVEMLMTGADVRAMGSLVGLISEEELKRGLELARMAGELWTISDVISVLEMPVLAGIPGRARYAAARDRCRTVAALHRHTRAR